MARSRPFLHQSSPRLTGSGAYPVRDESGEPLIRLQTMGAATILVGESRLTAAAGTLFSLLIRVAHAPGMLIGRDMLLRSLWPDQDEVRQRANLRQALYKLRGYGVRIGLAGDVVQLDGSQVLRTFSVERIPPTFERDVTLGHEPFGPFLAGFVVPWPEYQEWIATEREAVHAEVRRVLAGELRRRRERADWSGADALARWLLQFDPLNEEATLTIAECMALSGSKSEALATIDRYLAELGPNAGDIRLPATMLRRRIAEPHKKGRLSFAPTERHFIGRENEMADLTLRIRRARWHDGSGVLIHGAPGIGKSRLANELEKVAVIEGIRVTTYSCRESDMVRPLAVFADLLPEFMTYAGALGCDPASYDALRRLVPTDQREALFPSPVVPSAAPGAAPGAAPSAAPGAGAAGGEDGVSAPAGGSPEMLSTPTAVMRPPMPMMSTMRRALLDLLGAVTDERPMLFIIDDVHWIDEHSWDVLSDVIDRARTMRVCVLALSREPHARPLAPQRTSLALEVSELAPLSADSCVLLSRAIGDDLSASVSDELGAWFTGASEGNPLFLRALVNHWIETGEAGGVPPTLRGVIEQRLSQLSGDAMRVLQTAALLGRWATTERVMAVLEIPYDSALRIVNELEISGMLRSVDAPNIVCHDLISKSACKKLLPISKSLLHRAIARILSTEATTTSAASLFFPSLMHWKEAGEWKKVLELAFSHGVDIESNWQPIEILHLLESFPQQLLSDNEINELVGICSRLRVACGFYLEELGANIGAVVLPSVNSELSAHSAEKALSMVDCAYRSDAAVDLKRLIDFTVAVSELEHLSLPVRIRAAGIGLVILSNECENEIAHRLWCAIETQLDHSVEPHIASRIAVLYHTNYGDTATAQRIARCMLSEAKKDKMALSSPIDAIRAAFALRITSSIQESIDAFLFAYDCAIQLEIPAVAMNASWQIAQGYLDQGAIPQFQHWASLLADLHSKSSDRVATNFATALFCRGAIELGIPDDAKRYYIQFIADLPTRPTLRAEGHALALKTAIDLMDLNWEPNLSRIEALGHFAEKVTIFGASDFYASVYLDALARVSKDKAKTFQKKYISELRRDCSELSKRFVRSMERLE